MSILGQPRPGLRLGRQARDGHLCFFFPTFVILGFLSSRVLKRNDIADTFWGLGFLAVTLLSFEKFHFRGAILTSLVALWSLRLSFYLFFRNVGKPEDIRYVHMKKGWKNEPVDAFLRVFVLQGLLLVAVSLTLPMAVRNYQAIGPLDFLGLSLFIIGFVFEVTADIQLAQFKKNPENKDCQHQNLFCPKCRQGPD